MHLSREKWSVMLLRWTGFDASPELRLICAVIAEAIATRSQSDISFLAGNGLNNYCRLIGLDPQFVREQIGRADDFDKSV
jgi:hypothetical protein